MTTATIDMQGLGKDRAEAAIKNFDSVAKGIQETVTEMVEYGKLSFDRGIALTRDLAGVQNPAEAIQIEVNYWVSASEALASEMSKLGQLWANIAQENVKSFGLPVGR